MDNNRVRETTILRGICSAILAMAMPTLKNLKDLLSLFGYDLEKVK